MAKKGPQPKLPEKLPDGLSKDLNYFLRERNDTLELVIDFGWDDEASNHFLPVAKYLETKFGLASDKAKDQLLLVFSDKTLPSMIRSLRKHYPEKESTPKNDKPHLDLLIPPPQAEKYGKKASGLKVNAFLQQLSGIAANDASATAFGSDKSDDEIVEALFKLQQTVFVLNPPPIMFGKTQNDFLAKKSFREKIEACSWEERQGVCHEIIEKMLADVDIPAVVNIQKSHEENAFNLVIPKPLLESESDWNKRCEAIGKIIATLLANAQKAIPKNSTKGILVTLNDEDSYAANFLATLANSPKAYLR